MDDVISYLASKGLRGRPVSNGREHAFACFFECGEPSDSRKKKLYINAATGFYSCKVCGAEGGSFLLQRHFGDLAEGDDTAYVRHQILEAAASLAQQMLASRSDVLRYLQYDRGLTLETIIDRRLGFVPREWSLTASLPSRFTREQILESGLCHRKGPMAGRDYFADRIIIPIVSNGAVIQLRGRQFGNGYGPKYMTSEGDPVRLYNADSLRDATDVLLCEAELDCITAAQALAGASDDRSRAIAVIAIPGTNAIPEDLEDRLADAKRIFVGYDSDTAGRLAATKMVTRLGARAHLLELPDADEDWNSWLLPARPDDAAYTTAHPNAGHTGLDLMRLITAASGRRIFSVAEAGRRYRELLVARPGMKTGWKLLDDAIKPGLLPGQVMIFLGKAGTAKSVFTINMAYQMRAKRILLITLELTASEVYMRLRRIYLAHNPLATQGQLEYALGNIMICDENRIAGRDLVDLIDEYEEEMGSPVEVVAIDYLGYYARGQTGNSQYDKVSNAIMQLKEVGKEKSCSMFTPSQLGKGAKAGQRFDLDDARDSGVIGETADFAIGAWRPDMARGETTQAKADGQLMLELLKSRHGNAGLVFTLQMDLLTLALYDNDTEEAKMAREHNFMLSRGWDWDMLREAQLAPTQRELRFR